METKGDPAGARDFLERGAQSGSAESLEAYAQFLDRHHDPAARDVYEKLLKIAQGDQREYAASRLVILDLVAGDRDAASAIWNSIAPPAATTSVSPRFPAGA